jgi:acetylornithine/N-succinyldiaminopimelate aminotransferase
MLCKEKANVFQPGDHATTYGGNPLACAAGLAVAAEMDKVGFLSNVQIRGEQLRSGLLELKVKFLLLALWSTLDSIILN